MSPYLESLCLLVSCIVAGKIYHYLIKPEHFSVTGFSNFSIANAHYYNCPNNLYSSSVCHFHHGAPDVNPLPILTLRFVFAVAVIIHPTDPILPRSPRNKVFLPQRRKLLWSSLINKLLQRAHIPLQKVDETVASNILIFLSILNTKNSKPTVDLL